MFKTRLVLLGKSEWNHWADKRFFWCCKQAMKGHLKPSQTLGRFIDIIFVSSRKLRMTFFIIIRSLGLFEPLTAIKD